MPAPRDPSRPPVREVLAAAVEALGGQERPGQIAMAEAVSDSFGDRRHLVVQAGLADVDTTWARVVDQGLRHP